MNTPDTDDDGMQLDQLFTKRTAVIALVAAIVVLGAGAGITSNLLGTDTVQVSASQSDGGAVASASVPDGGTASISFAGTDVGDTSAPVSLQNLDVSMDEGGSLQLSGVSRVSASTVDSSPTSRSVGYLNVDHSEDGTIDSAAFSFTVRASVLQSNGVSPDEVTLYRLADGEWQTLETALQSTDGDVYTYRAVSPGLSVFGIGGAPPSEQSTTGNGPPADDTTDDTGDDQSGDDDGDSADGDRGADTTDNQTSTNETATPEPTPQPESDPQDRDDQPGPPSDTGNGADDSPAEPPRGSNGQQSGLTTTIDSVVVVPEVANDRGDVDVVAGTVAGTVGWSAPAPQRAVVTVSIGSGDGARELRRVTVQVGENTTLSLAEALVDTRLLLLTGDRADELSVPTDGRSVTTERTVTVSVTLSAGNATLATASDSSTVRIVVTNEVAHSGGDGNSNAGAT